MELKHIRILYVSGKGWYWYVVPTSKQMSYVMNGPHATYELAKADVLERSHG